jgi:HD-GYP domain-containing protein (c-di-GMP phosphodiesterase class II)
MIAAPASAAHTAADLARKLALPGTAITGIASCLEHWDGGGGPDGLEGAEIPMVGRVVAAADFAERAIDSHENPLKARAAAPQACRNVAGAILDPDLVSLLSGLMREDTFWLGLYDVRNNDLVVEAGVTSAERSGATRSSAANFARAFAAIIDAKAGYSAGHSVRAAGYAKAFAVAMGLSPEMAEALWFAALWHDIGVLGVPHRVIAKPDLLTIEEMDHVRSHPRFSHDVFQATPGFEGMADWVGAHHERIDGKGYPEGLEADEVPLQAQMLAIIDTFDALTSDRPYRRAMPRREAMKVIWAQAGAQFEASLIGVFETLVD